VVVLVQPRIVRQGKPNGSRKGRMVRAEARTVRLRPGSSICQSGTAAALGRPQIVRQSKPGGRVWAGWCGQSLGRSDRVQGRRSAKQGRRWLYLPYEFIGIPYKGWGCKSPFVADASDINTLLLVSYDEKLGATDFSNVRVNFLIDSSNPPICCFI
jgi:hypothetical protein